MKKGFTLIELLIVVAIIAILAAIAVPNFLEAQTRAKVSRAKADIRSIATGIEAYAVDHSKYPIDGSQVDGQAYWYPPGGQTTANGVVGLTSPVAYLSSAKFIDPFRTKINAATAHAADTPDNQYFEVDDYLRYRYTNIPYTYGPNATLLALQPGFLYVFGQWRLNSSGPDKSAPSAANGGVSSVQGASPAFSEYVVYDPTNGTISNGEIIRSQKHAEHKMAFSMN